MEVCSDYKETLLLDVYGEMDATALSAWEAHLKTCAGCREERFRMLRLIGRVKETMNPPPPAPGQSDALIRAVRSDFVERNEAKWWGGHFLGRPSRFVPSLAALCVFVIALSIFGLQTLYTPSTIQISPEHKALEEPGAEDLEIIEHLDILMNMDLLDKLVQAVDETDGDRPAPEIPQNSQGMTENETERIFA